MRRVFSPDGQEERLIHTVDWPGYHHLGWLLERPAESPAPEPEPEPEPESELPEEDVKVEPLTAAAIAAMPWRQQRALLSPEQQSKKPPEVSWGDWAISLLVEGL